VRTTAFTEKTLVKGLIHINTKAEELTKSGILVETGSGQDNIISVNRDSTLLAPELHYRKSGSVEN
jgi:hypothetical protein